MTMTNPNKDTLDDLFAASRAHQPAPGNDLMARVLADAAGIQTGFATAAVPAQPGLWARMMDAIGGWPAVSGLAAATVAGVWVGVAPPNSIEDLTASYWGDGVSVSMFSTDLTFDMGDTIDG
jgi:hypothetical protein